jgi:hypothetical protein
MKQNLYQREGRKDAKIAKDSRLSVSLRPSRLCDLCVAGGFT